MNNIKIIKLTTDQDIIAEILEESPFALKVKNPIAVLMIPPQKGSPQAGPNIGFAPWSPYVEWDKGVDIKISTVVFVAPAAQELIDQYKSLFSNIIQPKKSLLVPE